MLDHKQITDDLRGLFRGRLHFDRLTRGLYSTDASPFQIEPQLVAVPEDAESVASLVRYCHEHAVSVTARGAGTGLSGESLNSGVALDLSVHFRKVLAVGADTVTVQAGAVLHQLNAELAKVGRRFAPDPASAAACTLGGMIATNASGGNAAHHHAGAFHGRARLEAADVREFGRQLIGLAAAEAAHIADFKREYRQRTEPGHHKQADP